jgi:hypothetical protein
MVGVRCGSLLVKEHVIHVKPHFEANSTIHNVNTRTKYDLHYPLSQLTVFQKGTYYDGIKMFNSLPAVIKELSHNIKQFKIVLKNFLLLHSFYTLDEYFKYKN